MGGTVSYINPDGGVTNADKDFYCLASPEPDATGVTSFAGVVDVFKNIKDNNIVPFLVVDHAKFTSNLDRYMPMVWDDYDTGGWDWGVRTVPFSIVARNETQKDASGQLVSNYIRLGDAVSWDSGDAWNSGSYTGNLKNLFWLYAHKSICYDCPSQVITRLKKDYQVMYNANVANTPNDAPSLYQALGFFGRPKNGKCVAVLRAFLQAAEWPGGYFDVWENCCGGPIYFINQCSVKALVSPVFVNTLAVKYAPGWDQAKLTVNYEVCVNVDKAINNWVGCVLQKSSQRNRIFQGFTNSATGLREENNASSFMRAFCSTSLEATDYPEVCSCLGRAGVEAALRTELGNDQIRMVCYSQACIDGQQSGNVYTFTPSPPCAPINICKPGVDITAAKVSMTNVTFNCDGKTTAVPPPSNAAPTPPPSTTATPPPSSSSTQPEPTPPPSSSTTPVDSTVTGAADTNNTGLIIGAAVGGVVLVIMIVVIVVLVKKSKKPKIENKV